MRVQYDDHDIVLENPVPIDPLRHMGNRRFSADPTVVSDDEASALLDDIIRDNPDKQPELAMMINRINQIRRASRPKSRVVRRTLDFAGGAAAAGDRAVHGAGPAFGVGRFAGEEQRAAQRPRERGRRVDAADP